MVGVNAALSDIDTLINTPDTVQGKAHSQPPMEAAKRIDAIDEKLNTIEAGLKSRGTKPSKKDAMQLELFGVNEVEKGDYSKAKVKFSYYNDADTQESVPVAAAWKNPLRDRKAKKQPKQGQPRGTASSTPDSTPVESAPVAGSSNGEPSQPASTGTIPKDWNIPAPAPPRPPVTPARPPRGDALDPEPHSPEQESSPAPERLASASLDPSAWEPARGGNPSSTNGTARPAGASTTTPPHPAGESAAANKERSAHSGDKDKKSSWKRKLGYGALGVLGLAVIGGGIFGVAKMLNDDKAPGTETVQIAERAPDMKLTETEMDDYFSRPGDTVFGGYKAENAGNENKTMEALNHDADLAVANESVERYDTGSLDNTGAPAWALVAKEEGKPVVINAETTNPDRIARILAGTPGAMMQMANPDDVEEGEHS